MKQVILISYLLIHVIAGQAVNQPMDSIHIQGNEFKVDLLGNIYWTEHTTLKKYNPDKGNTIEYTNTFLGEIEKYDVSNPLKILVYYETHNQLVFLDKNLREIASPISLDNINLSQVGAICTSHNGGFWILNSMNQRIEHYNQNLQLTTETTALQELYNTSSTDFTLIERNNMLYCFIPGCCLYTFDLYGNFSKKHPLKIVNNIQIINKNIFYFYEETLNRYNLNTLDKDTIKVPYSKEKWEDIKILKDGTQYGLKKKKIYIYK